MTGKLKGVEKSNASSIEIGSSSDSSSDSEGVDGAFDEGKANRSADEAATPSKAYVPVCPTPVRILIGVFSTLLTVGGGAMSVIGANALYDPPAPNPSLYRGLLGGGIALLAAGGFGIASTFFEREQVQPAAART